jgi:predicted ATP-dependent serine protease
LRATDSLCRRRPNKDAVAAIESDDGEPEDVFDFLAEDDDDYDWLVLGVLERGDRLLLTGREGFGKSYLVQQIATQLAAGVHPFATEEETPLRVLYVDVENPGRELRRRQRRLNLAAGDRLKRRQLFVRPRPKGLDLTDPEDAEWLADEVEHTCADVLVVGPLYKLSLGDPSDEREAKPVALFFDELISHFGITIILEAHMPHDGKGRAVRVVGLASLAGHWD